MSEISGATWLGGLIFGAVQWLVVGIVMGMIPIMHVGIKSGAVKAPGMWMTNSGGAMAFVVVAMIVGSSNAHEDRLLVGRATARDHWRV